MLVYMVADNDLEPFALANLNSGAQAFAALDIRDSADRGDTVSALVTVP